MKDIIITLPDGTKKGFQAGITVCNVLKELEYQRVVAARIYEDMVDLHRTIQEDVYMQPVMLNSKEGLEIYRHSASHIMAQAVKELYKDVKLGIGPAIEKGFYYDFETSHTFTPEDLPRIEEKMNEIIQRDVPFIKQEITRAEALELFRKRGEPYKLEIIEEIPDSTVSIYKQDGLVDLCRGPHLPSTGWIKAVKLTGLAGAYWRGDEKNIMLQRIYGTAFLEQRELDEHLVMMEEAKKRDHRRLGKELDLFSIHENIGPGLICWHPKGAVARHIIEEFWKKEHTNNGYQMVYSPHIAKMDIWKTSGHLEFYKENLYSPMNVDGVDYIVKPMNCPFHIHIYKNHLRSYRELPIRYAELGTVYRYERSGVLHGLLRVRGFTQDDAHIFCRPDQLEKEIKEVLDLTMYVLKRFGFKDFDVYLSTRPEHFVGTVEGWEKATDALRNALVSSNIPFQIDPGEGVFYGPKIDIKIRDSLGRLWQCSTIQVDFNLPERFEVTFINPQGMPEQPIVIHRALMGSLERFFGCLIEHYGGAFPLWLAPVQVILLSISEECEEYVREVYTALNKGGFRVETDIRQEKLGFKIREAQLKKIPYMVVLGKKEKEGNILSPRSRSKGTLSSMSVEEFIDKLNTEIERGGEA